MTTIFTFIIILLFSYYIFSNEKTTVTMKYYLFDWDDNIMYMPSKVYLQTQKRDEIGISTEEFRSIRHKLNEHFEYNGEIITGLSSLAFRDFRCGYIPFMTDVQNSQLGPSWDDFVEAINNGSYFAIITARGHNPQVLRRTIETFIENDYKGISRDSLVYCLKQYHYITNKEYINDDDAIKDYLNDCLFYPVAYHNKDGSLKPEHLKTEQIKQFINTMKVHIKIMESSTFKFKFIPKFGFSDDDPHTIEYSKQIEELNIYSTEDGTKTLVQNDDIR